MSFCFLIFGVVPKLYDFNLSSIIQEYDLKENLLIAIDKK